MRSSTWALFHRLVMAGLVFAAASFAAGQTLSSLTLSPTSIVGSKSSTANTVTLTAPAPAGGAVVTLSSNNSQVAAVPPSVTVPAGSTSKTFTITTTAVTTNVSVTITAIYGVTKMATLTVTPWLNTLTLSPTTLVGGSSSTANTVTLYSGAPAGGLLVSLSSSNTQAATVPASVVFPAGATSRTFTITTFQVAANTSVTISASHAGTTRTKTLTVTPCTVPAAGPPSLPPDVVWVEDALPAGATPFGTWVWDTVQKASGTKSHTEPAAAGKHEHYFTGATSTLTIGPGDKLVSYVLISPCDPPQEIMLQWYEGGSWEHRAFWGADLIPNGAAGSHERFPMGPIPQTGQWARLEVPASAVGLVGKTISGMAFTLYGGKAWFDRAGKVACSVPVAPPPSLPGDTVWFDDQLPAGATATPSWVWDTVQKASGTKSHTDAAGDEEHSHSFTGATQTLSLSSTDLLVCYVLVDPCNPPKEITLGWDPSGGGSDWEHRAIWGSDRLQGGISGTPSRFPMGPIPTSGQWVRLEVPAAAVNLSGQTVRGMWFGAYGGHAWFDRPGKTSATYANLAVTQNVFELNGAAGGTVQYTSYVPATLTETLVIKNALGQVVRTLVNATRGPGTYVDSWNGRNSGGVLQPDGPYFYVATATSGGQSKNWDLSNQFIDDVAPGSPYFLNILYDPQSTFMPFGNLPLSLSYDNPVPGRSWVIFTPNGFMLDETGLHPDLSICNHPPHFCAPSGEYQSSGPHSSTWAAVDPAGNFRQDIQAIGVWTDRRTFSRNAVVVFGSKPTISNLQVLPANYPPAMGQQSITFNLATYQNQPATVSVKLQNQGSLSVLRTISIASQAPGSVTILWDGRADNGMWVAAGPYTVTVTATDGIGNQVSSQILTKISH